MIKHVNDAKKDIEINIEVDEGKEVCFDGKLSPAAKFYIQKNFDYET